MDKAFIIGHSHLKYFHEYTSDRYKRAILFWMFSGRSPDI